MGLRAEKFPWGLRWKINQASPGRYGAASFVGKNRKIHPGNRKSLDGQAPANQPHPPNKSICEVTAHLSPPSHTQKGTWRDSVGVKIYIRYTYRALQTELVFDSHRGLKYIELFAYFNGWDMFNILRWVLVLGTAWLWVQENSFAINALSSHSSTFQIIIYYSEKVCFLHILIQNSTRCFRQWHILSID